MAFLGAIVVFLHLLYGEIILRTRDNHRLPGYTEKYLGRPWKPLVSIIEILGSFGALLVYIILGGQFLFLVFQSFFGGSYPLYVFLFWFIFSFVIFRGLKLIGPLELLLDGLLIAVLLSVVFIGLPSFNLGNLTPVSWADFFLPYGIFLFAISGAIAIPEMKDELGSNRRLLRSAIIMGTLLSVGISALFGGVIAGITGGDTTVDALGGLQKVLGGGIVKFVAFFGFLSIATSFSVLGVYLKDVFALDFNINKGTAGLLVVLIPVVAFGLGLQSFVKIIGFLGSVTVALSSIAIIFIFIAAKKKGDLEPEYQIAPRRLLLIGLVILFAIGFIHQLIFNL